MGGTDTFRQGDNFLLKRRRRRKGWNLEEKIEGKHTRRKYIIVMEERKDGRVEHWWGMEEGKI